MLGATTDTKQEKEEWARQFWAERQKEAEAAGMNVYTYMAQVDGGILKNTMTKLLRHAQAHPSTCPPDCAFQASLKRLKEQYGVS
jgi:hypothetical protein